MIRRPPLPRDEELTIHGVIVIECIAAALIALAFCWIN